jgi:hypothetical protein
MAGRPKTRAKRLAEALAAKHALENPPPDWEQMGAPETVSPARQIQTEDRVNLHEWWKEQAEFMEKEQESIVLALHGAGPHPNLPYARQIRRLGALGISIDLIAIKLGMSEGMLLQHYEEDLKQGEASILGPVMANMLRMATSGNGKWALKAGTEILNRRGGPNWRPPAQQVEITDDRKTPGKGIIDSAKLSWEQREQLRAIVEEQLGMRGPFLTNGLGAAKDNGTVIDAEPDDGGQL